MAFFMSCSECLPDKSETVDEHDWIAVFNDLTLGRQGEVALNASTKVNLGKPRDTKLRVLASFLQGWVTEHEGPQDRRAAERYWTDGQVSVYPRVSGSG